jgi:hypothetical protein
MVTMATTTSIVALPAGTNGGQIDYDAKIDRVLISGVAGVNTAASSSDGVTFVQLTTPFSNPLITSASDLGYYSGIDNSGNAVYTSPTGFDGSWVIHPVAPFTFDAFECVRILQFGRFYSSTADIANRIATSTDGITWTTQAAAHLPNSFVYSPLLKRLVVTSSTGGMYTDDGKTWIEALTQIPMNGLCWSDYWQCFLATDQGAHKDRLYKSVDGSTWTTLTAFPGNANALRAITWIQDLMCYVVTGDTDPLYISQDGSNWKRVYLLASGGDMYANAYIPQWGMYISCGISGNIRVTPKLFQ